ncbi:MAG: hypothetical protein IGS03_12935 [Candidatus Sericytochromatia bacterium]|nr:hypothetical protein [Candidatus Sericytochromatia bacterium]
MAYKACSKCQKSNAISNADCVRCGRSLRYEPIQYEAIGANRKAYWLERFFSSMLAGSVVVSLFFALMNWLDQPVLTVFQLQ